LLLLGVCIILIIENVVTKRLLKLSKEISEINESKNLSKRVSFSNKDDEVSELSLTVNEMLDTLEISIENEKRSIESEKRAIDSIREHTEEIEKINKLMIGRELKMVEMKKELEILKNDRNI
jgi:methyl-accepting chemotaxis protein